MVYLQKFNPENEKNIDGVSSYVVDFMFII